MLFAILPISIVGLKGSSTQNMTGGPSSVIVHFAIDFFGSGGAWAYFLLQVPR